MSLSFLFCLLAIVAFNWLGGNCYHLDAILSSNSKLIGFYILSFRGWGYDGDYLDVILWRNFELIGNYLLPKIAFTRLKSNVKEL